VRGTLFSSEHPNNVCVADGVLHRITGIVIEDDAPVFTVQRLLNPTNLYDFGVPSSVSDEPLHITPDRILCKCIPLILSQHITCIPLLHTFE
jgi:hypothetical protein